LIAEDSADNREMMGAFLQLQGYAVLGTEDGPQTVEVATKELPDLLLLDLALPHLDGFEVASRLRRLPRLRDTPIIMVSGYDPKKYRQKALDVGCTDYLFKPIDFDQLEQILMRELGPWRSAEKSSFSQHA